VQFKATSLQQAMSGRRKEQELFAESATPRTAKCFTAWHGTGFQQNQCMRVVMIGRKTKALPFRWVIQMVPHTRFKKQRF